MINNNAIRLETRRLNTRRNTRKIHFCLEKTIKNTVRGIGMFSLTITFALSLYNTCNTKFGVMLDNVPSVSRFSESINNALDEEDSYGAISAEDVEKTRENNASEAIDGISTKELFVGGPDVEKGYDISKDVANFGSVSALLDNLYEQGVWDGNNYSRDVDTKNGKHKNYDLIHLRAYQFGLKPNYFASVMAIESGGDTLADSGMSCFGLFQINKDEWSKFIGVEFIRMDGSIGTITLEGSGYEGYALDQSVKGNPWDPEANSYVGAALLRSSVKKYGNPWVVYGVHNGGEGFALFLKKYLSTDTTNMTLTQIEDTIHKHCKKIPHGWWGETDIALTALSDIYNRNVQ